MPQTIERIEKVAAGCEHQAALERRRDEFLIKLLALVKDYWPENERLTGRI